MKVLLLPLCALGLLSSAYAAEPVAEPATLSTGLPTALARSEAIAITRIDGDGLLHSQAGQVIKLAGLRLIREGDCERLPLSCPLHRQTLRLLGERLLEQRTTLAHGPARRDRYGRQVAHIETAEGRWLQEGLLRLGLARIENLQAPPAVIARLREAEASARAAERGLWALRAYRVRDAENLKDATNRFQLVKGRIHRVAVFDRITYLNFAENWRRDFTIALPAEAQGNFPAEQWNFKALEGRRVRVRGWLFWRNGPMIELRHPWQLEHLETPPPNGQNHKTSETARKP